MQCHANCAACCIATTISTTLPGMSGSKPAGVPCINLSVDLRCNVYENRPAVCRNWVADEEVCGDSHIEALINILQLELATR